MSPKPTLVVSPDLLKSQVKAYTRKDGAFVAAHSDNRVAAAPHPNVVGKAEKLQGGDASKAHGMHFAGKEYSASGKSGTSNHDQTPVRHFKEVTGSGNDDGQHVWMDHGGNVHADAKSEAPRLRKEYEAHTASQKAAPAKFDGAAVAKKHGDKMERKASEWQHDGYEGKKIPASDVAGAPEFTHKEVYGHDRKTSPAGTDFSSEFAAKGHTHFVMKHSGGQRSFVNTEGGNYARYHAPVENAPAKKDEGGYSAPAEGDVGHDEHKQYGKYFRKGDKVKDGAGVHHEVLSHTGAGVTTTGGGTYHPTKLDFVSSGMQKSTLVVRPDLLKAHVESYTRKDGVTVAAHDDNRQAAAGAMQAKHQVAARKAPGEKPQPARTVITPRMRREAEAKGDAVPKTHSFNKGYGFYGEAHSHAREKFPDTDADQHAEKSFSEAAHHLVSAGHFDNHKDAGTFLDSRAGRHLHNASDGGDISKVGSLGGEVNAYKQSGMQKSTLVVRPDLLKAHVEGFTRKDGTVVKPHERQIEAHGVKGMKSTPWRKTFKSQKHFDDFMDKSNGDHQVLGFRELDADPSASKLKASHVDVQGEDRYEFANGKKPGGKGGSYIFSPHKSHDFGTHGAEAGEHFFQSEPGAGYTDAKKAAKAWGASKGHGTVHLQS